MVNHMKRFSFLLILIVCIVVGCSPNSTDKIDVKTVGNEKELFNINFIQNKSLVLKSLGNPDEKVDENYIYNEHEIAISFEDNEIESIKIFNPDFVIGESVKIGSTVEELIENDFRLTFYQYYTPEKERIVFFQKELFKVVLKIKENKVKDMTIFSEEVPYSKYVSGTSNGLDDRELKLNSEYINFLPNTERNNRKIIAEDFISFANMGMVNMVPVPINMDEKELLRRYGDGEFIYTDILSTGISEFYLFYREFGVYFGINNDKVEEIVIPVTLKEEEIISTHNFNNNSLILNDEIELRCSINTIHNVDQIKLFVVITKRK